jgi:hypothetical protein
MESHSTAILIAGDEPILLETRADLLKGWLGLNVCLQQSGRVDSVKTA